MTTNTRSVDREPLDAITDSILLRLKRLAWRHAALFSAAVAERFSLVYEIFALKHDLKNPLVVRCAVDAVWRFLEEDCSAHELRRKLAEVERVTPTPEDYGSLESVLAHNACIAVDAAIRSCLDPKDVGPVAGEYGIEALRAAVSHAETGFIDVGSGSEFSDFLAALASHPIVAKEIELQQSDLSKLESESDFSTELVLELRRSAENNRIGVVNLVRE